MNISVVIPVKNRLDLLVETLSSCVAQTYRDFEVIVVDDGSDVDMATAVADWKSENAAELSIRVVRQESGGAPKARNTGLAEAKGRFINFLDSDNLAHPQKLERLLAVLESSDADAVYSLVEFFYSEPGDRETLWNAPDERDVLDRFLSDDPVWDTCSVLWRREAVERIGGWNEGLVCWQDWELHVRALAGGCRFQAVPEVLQFYRDHDGDRISASSDQQRIQLCSRVEAFRSAATALRDHDLLSEERKSLLFRSIVRLAYEATTRRDLGLASSICRDASAFLSSASLSPQWKVLQRSLRWWSVLTRIQKNPFARACEKLGLNVEDLFPDSCWGQSPAEPFRL